MAFGKKIRSLDIFKKIPSEISRPTDLGGMVSIVTALLISYLFYRQTSAYLHPEYIAEISNDKLFTRQQMTYWCIYGRINLDIQFPAFPCEVISLDLQDIMISHHPNIGSVEKWRLDREGNYIDSTGFQLLREHSPRRQLEMIRQAFKMGYGCRLVGDFTVKQVPGNFHISNHAYYNHYMQVKMQGHAPQLNMSHIIHRLYFGRERHLSRLKSLHPQGQIHLLEGRRAVETMNRSYSYHIDIVPTWYHEGVVSNFYTYQYTYHRNVYRSQQQQPGVVHFDYHIGGLVVEVEPRDQDFFMFVVHLCAILGGAYAICRAIYNWISNFVGKWEYQLIQ